MAWIHDPRGTVAPELVRRCHEDFCARRFRSRYGFIDILDVDVEHNWRTPIWRRWPVGNLWPFALDHDHRRPNRDQRVRRLAVCARPAIQLDGVECPQTKSDFSFGIATKQPRDDCRGALRERLLPTGTSELVFSIDVNGRAASGVSGARSEALTLDTSTPFSVIAVHFTPGGSFPFFGVPSTELCNQGAALDLLWGRDASSFRDRLWEEKTADKRFNLLEAALLRRARGRFDRHAAVRYALDVFDRSNGMRPAHTRGRQRRVIFISSEPMIS
jgi:uncharacterized protein DUF6597